MRLFKLILTLVVLGLIALFVYQNMPTWLKPIDFKLNLYFFQTDQASPPVLQLYLVMLLSALGGFVFGLLAMFKPYRKTRRTLARERQEKKMADEAPTLKQAEPEPNAEVLEPANPGK